MLPIPGYRRRMNELAEPRARCLMRAARFFEMLGESKRPLIYAGGGVINANAAAALSDFAAVFGIPVVTTLMGIGAIDTTSPLCMRMLGMHGTAFANYAVDDCDFLIAVGARFDDRVAGVPAKFARNAQAHRASRHRSRRDQQGQAGAVEPCRPAAGGAAGADRVRPAPAVSARTTRTWHAQLAELKRVYAMNYDRNSALIQPYYVIEEINRHAKRRGHHHHRRRPASDVGRAVLRFPPSAPVADLRQHGHDGLRPAGRHRRADRESAAASSSTSMATPASA